MQLRGTGLQGVKIQMHTIEDVAHVLQDLGPSGVVRGNQIVGVRQQLQVNQHFHRPAALGVKTLHVHRVNSIQLQQQKQLLCVPALA